jgi:hypothetical protein
MNELLTQALQVYYNFLLNLSRFLMRKLAANLQIESNQILESTTFCLLLYIQYVSVQYILLKIVNQLIFLGKLILVFIFISYVVSVYYQVSFDFLLDYIHSLNPKDLLTLIFNSSLLK